MSDILDKLRAFYENAETDECLYDIRRAIEELERLYALPVFDGPPTWQEEVAAVEEAFERSGVNPTWPDDEPANIGPMAAAMADEIERLRLAVAEKNAIRLGELAYPGLRVTDKGKWVDVWATLRGLVERQNRIVCDTKMDATLGEGTVRDDGSVSSSSTKGHTWIMSELATESPGAPVIVEGIRQDIRYRILEILDKRNLESTHGQKFPEIGERISFRREDIWGVHGWMFFIHRSKDGYYDNYVKYCYTVEELAGVINSMRLEIDNEFAFKKINELEEEVKWYKDNYGVDRVAAAMADEIRRLTLTDEELDAIEHGLEQIELHSDLESRSSAKALSGLLDRLGNDECTA